MSSALQVMNRVSVDAAAAASAVVMNLQTIVSREMDPLEPGCVTVGRIQSGSRFNVRHIPKGR